MESKKRIVVIEDDEDSRLALCAILEGLGFEAVSFRRGKDAIAALPGQKVDLALVDIMMPEMNGYEVLQVLKASDEFKNLPVIMVTAKDEDNEVIEGYQYGADYYITKPFTTKQLEYGIRLYLV